MEIDPTDADKWTCIDPRPLVCPNGCGLFEIQSATDVECPDCGYRRTVIEPIEKRP